MPKPSKSGEEGTATTTTAAAATPGSGRSKKSKKQFCTGQTDDERRQIRAAQRQVAEHITTTGDVVEGRDANNQIYDKVRYAREAVLDSENMQAIASKFASHMETSVSVPRYDPRRLLTALGSKCQKNGAFDWATLGVEVGVCYGSVPARVTFLAGALQAVKKQRAVPQRHKREREILEATAPEQMQHVVDEANGQKKKPKKNETLTDKAIKQLNKTLLQCTNDRQVELTRQGRNDVPPDLDALQLLINPRSFTQTVENIFHMSFAIKDGAAGVEMEPVAGDAADDDTNGRAAASWRVWAAPDTGEANRPTTQSVMAFTMHDWRRLCQAHNLTVDTTLLPNRPRITKTQEGQPLP